MIDETMNKQGCPNVRVIKSRSSKYGFDMLFTDFRGEILMNIIVNGHPLNLDMAPKNCMGTVELLELRPDNMVWASGVPFFDPSTGMYYPKGIPEKEEEEEEASRKKTKKKTPKKRTKRRRKSKAVMVDSVETVEPGGTVIIC